MTANLEVKGTLAKLLATEDLIVEHKTCETASFDVDRRVLTLPIWDVPDIVYNLLVGHEVGHALYTPNEDWTESFKSVPKSYVNVVEDARIEKCMKQKFPGLRKDFTGGYSLLNEQDFFQVRNVELEQLKLIDRINLHFKIGAYALMPFNATEQQYVDKVDNIETFEDAIEVAREIYEYAKAEAEKEKIDTVEDGNEDGGTGSDGDGEGREWFTDTDPEGQPDKSQPQDPDLDTPSYEEGDQEEGADVEYPEYQQDIDVADTDKALAESLEQRTQKEDNYGNTTKYLEIPDFPIKEIIVPAEKVWGMFDDFYKQDCFTNQEHMNPSLRLLQDYKVRYQEWKKNASREVAYLSKEFELKKSASAYAREQVSRTGVIDTNKLNSYLWNDDIFRKVTTTKDGKNHGLIFLLDWSGSMADQILDTVKQLISLCSFCRKSNIPFAVYAFVCDGHYMREEDYDKVEGQYYIPNHFALPCYLHSEMNTQKFEDACAKLFAVTTAFNDRRSWDANLNVPSHLGLGGTPLNDAIACLQSLIPFFKNKHNVEKVHVSILTDGESNAGAVNQKSTLSDDDYMYKSALGYGYRIRDRKNGRVYKKMEDNYSGVTTRLLEYIKGRFPEVNFLGFRIITTRDLNWILGHGVEANKMRQLWKKEKALTMPNHRGYQELYYINDNSVGVEVEFDVAEDATKAQIKSAFKKSLKNKANNKRILSSFIAQIA